VPSAGEGPEGDRLLIHNAIALRDAEMAELEAWGKPTYLLVPNSFHRQDAWIWKQRYPSLKVLCPEGCAKKIAAEVAVDGFYTENLADPSVQLFHWRGSKDREGAVMVREAGRATLIANDLVINVPKQGGVMGFFLAPTGVPSVPRISRWMLLQEQKAFKQHLLDIAGTPGLERVLVGHGPTLEANSSSALREAAARLS
jgi:hypothetical protein